MNEQNPEGNPFQNAVVESHFALEGRSVEAGRGVEWLKQGWYLFVKTPGIWIAIVIIFAVIAIVLSIIPILGSLALNLLTPVFGGGIILGCKALADGEELRIDHLFAGFKQNTGSLIMLGVLCLVAGLIIMLIGFAVGGSAAMTGAAMGNMAGAGMAAGGFLLGMLLILLLSIPLSMALWFAPALVVLRNVSPMDAIKASFNACLKNIVPMLVYGILVIVLAIIAAIPLGLGYLIFLPVMLGSIYSSYVNLFE